MREDDEEEAESDDVHEMTEEIEIDEDARLGESLASWLDHYHRTWLNISLISRHLRRIVFATDLELTTKPLS